MTTEWKDMPTLQDVAKAQADGWEIEIQTNPDNDKYCPFRNWNGRHWHTEYLFRGRPRQPKMKTITLRKALMWLEGNGYYVSEVEVNDAIQNRPYFVRWMGMPYTTEVPDDN